MNVKVYFLFLLLAVSILAKAQCPTANFNAPPTGCRNEQFALTNTSTDATSYEWDFCAGDFELTPQAETVVNSTLLFRTRAIRVIREGNEWFAFTIDQASSPNRLIRFEFGESLMNVPTIADLGNPADMLNGAYDFRMLREDGVWYAVVANSGGNNLLLMTFSSGLKAMPEVENLGGFGALNVPNGIFLLRENNALHAFVSNGGAAEVVRLDFSASILNTPTASTFPVAGGNVLRGISIVKECDRWFGLVTSYSGGKVYWLDFSDGIAQPPATGEIAFYNSYFFPASVVINQDGGNYYAFVQSALGPLYRLSFGSSIVDKDGSGSDLGNLGITGETFALEWVKTESTWIGFSMDLSNRRLARITLPTTCDGSIATAKTESPTVSYTTDGTKRITLTATSDGLSNFSSREIVVSPSVSPDIDFTSNNICASHDINFSAVNSSDDIASYEWDFGDATQPSIVANPTHVYASPGTFKAKLQVTGQNGCINLASKSLKVYDEPVSQFVMPNTVLCTNTEITVTNATTDDYDGNLQYSWSVDNVQVSTARNLITTFGSTGTKTIRLETSIAGCADDYEIVSDAVKPGPVVNFSVAGNCEKTTIEFTPTVSEPVNAYQWNFDDGNLSADQVPVHVFSAEGVYQVSLAVLSSNGCTNTKEISLVVNDQPEPDFIIEGPPSSCSGYLSHFIDLTPQLSDGNLESWQWNFNDGGSATEQNPSYVFEAAGQYQVELMVTSEHGCSKSVLVPTTILQSPTVNVENSIVCLNKPVTFTAASPDNLRYYWEIGTSYYEVQNPEHTFLSTGEHMMKLNAVAENDCITTITRSLTVPVPNLPTFSYTNNCKDAETRFTSLAEGNDAIVGYFWNFAGEGSSTEQGPSFQFTSLGNKAIGLEVTAASGCQYQSYHIVNIIEAPIADFTFTPDFGVPSQEISFVNASTNATAFHWSFGDGGTSTENSPTHTFTDLGDYSVQLLASNSAGCESLKQQTIAMVAPVPDVDLNLMTITPNNDGTLKIILTIENKGNTYIQNLPVKLDLGGTITLETTVQETIAPYSFYNLVLDFSIAQSPALTFLCASATLAGDLHPDGNRICEQLKSGLAIITPHPNPVTDFLILEWIAASSEAVEVQIIDNNGRTAFSSTVITAVGLNRSHIDVRILRSGNYILRIITQAGSESHRILISH